MDGETERMRRRLYAAKCCDADACNCGDHPERAAEDRALEAAATLNERARRAYESDPIRVIGAGPWDNLPEVMRAVWRAHVTGNLPPR